MDPVSGAITGIAVGKEGIKTAVGVAKTVASGYGRRSIARLAKEAIFQFPMMISSDIDPDDSIALAKSFEKEYASFVIAAMALEHDVDRSKYQNIRDYLKTFHNNTNIPAAVFNSGNILMESATIVTESSTVVVDPITLYSLWTAEESQFDTEIINDMYKPFTNTLRKMAERIDLAIEAKGNGRTDDEEVNLHRRLKEIDEQTAKKVEQEKQRLQADARKTLRSEQMADWRAQQSELRKQRNEDFENQRKKQNMDWETRQYAADRAAHYAKMDNADGKGEYHKAVKGKSDTAKGEFLDAHPNIQRAKDAAAGYYKSGSFKGTYGMGNRWNGIAPGQDRFTGLEPTLVQVTLNSYTGTQSWNDNLTLGIKCMVRLVPSGPMTANMIEAVSDRGIFKLAKWNKGEYKLCDLLFGAKKYKQLGIDSAKGKWLAALKKRAAIDNVSRFAGARLLPTATIIITETEALRVKDATGIDLHNKSTMLRLFKKYFLLGFGIYDTETRVLSAMFDGDSDWTEVSMRALVAGVKKETDLLNNVRGRF